jgi:hypothetical protein
MKNFIFWDVGSCVCCDNRLTLFSARGISSTLKMEETLSSETSVYNKPRCHIPEDGILQHFSYFDPDYLTFCSSVSGLSEGLL